MTVSSSNRYHRIPRTSGKKVLRGTRWKAIHKKTINNSSYHRSCPSRTRTQQENLDYHNSVSANLEQLQNGYPVTNSFPIDLPCSIWDVMCNSSSQLDTHFATKSHKLVVWEYKPKCCTSCCIYWGFNTPQL